MTEIPVQRLTREGAALPSAAQFTSNDATSDADGELTIEDNDGNIFFEVSNENNDSGTVTVSVVTALEVAGQQLQPTTITLAAPHAQKIAGPWPPVIFNQADGSVTIQVTTDGQATPDKVFFRAYAL